jgi:hypothetical protein
VELMLDAVVAVVAAPRRRVVKLVRQSSTYRHR